MFRCFVSHPWASNIHHFAVRLVAALRDRRVQVWIDQEQILPGQKISVRQHNGIVLESDVFLFVLAPATLNSANCMEELACAVAFHKPIITVVIEHCAPPEVLSDSIFVDFSNPVFFESAVDRLLAGAVKQAEWQAILGKLNDDDPDQRIEAVRLLIEMQDPAAFPAVKQRLVIERDDTVKQWIAGFFGGIRFPTPEMAREARRILEDLDANGEFLTRRAARQAIEGLRNCD